MKKNFISDIIAIEDLRKVKVFHDYDKLDDLAKKLNYFPIEISQDERFDSGNLRVGMQNNKLHCGWIATWGDSSHSIEDMAKLLNQKIQASKKDGDLIKVGFCQTGNFSVGYTIYVERRD